jgi:hypothetical protein
VDWVKLAKDRVKLQVLENVEWAYRFHKKAGEFCDQLRKNLHLGVS